MWSQIFALFFALLLSAGAAEQGSAEKIAALVDPAKLATLKERGAIPRVQKIIYHLQTARDAGEQPAAVLSAALSTIAATNAIAAQLTKDALLRNLEIASRLGCTNEADLNEMKHGKSPTVRAGPYKGDELSVDHIIPFKVAPELDNVLANLELMPLRANQKKSVKIGPRQRQLASDLKKAGLLSLNGYEAIVRHK